MIGQRSGPGGSAQDPVETACAAPLPEVTVPVVAVPAELAVPVEETLLEATVVVLWPIVATPVTMTSTGRPAPAS